MNRLTFLFVTFFLLAPQVRAQATSSDSQILRALLDEVRQLRQDLKTSTAQMERAQILMHRLQLQEGVVERASHSLDEARAKLTQIQSQRKNFTDQVKRLEESQTASTNAADQKPLADALASMKARLDVLGTEEQDAQAIVTDRDGQLRTEQGKLTELQERLDQLESSLAKQP